MTKYSRHAFSAFLALAIALIARAETPQNIMRQVANASGLEAFDGIESLEFTFNVKTPKNAVQRTWTWWPGGEERVKLVDSDTPESALEYQRGDSADPEIDRKFVNDLYWLVFPFVVVWDDTVTLDAIELSDYTGGIEASGGVRVTYPEGVGYTPGDVYEVYYDEDFLVTHWVFRKGGSETPSLITSWNDYEAVGPLKISMERPQYPEGGFRLWFTDVKVVRE